jgi:hypothetical protein
MDTSIESDSGLSLSIIVTIVSGKKQLIRCLDSLIPQVRNKSIEVIVPCDSLITYIDGIESKFPDVKFLDIGEIKTHSPASSYSAQHEIYDQRTAQGLKAARGKVVGLLHDYGVPGPDWCDRVVSAHKLTHAVIGGAIEHVGKGAVNTAAYYLDFGRYQLPLPEGTAAYLSDVNVTYKKEALNSIKEFWEDRYVEVVVNWKLSEIGETLWLRPDIVVNQDWGGLALKATIKERFAWGRLFASVRIKDRSLGQRLFRILISPLIPFLMLGRIILKASRDGRNRKNLLSCLPQLFLITYAYALGEMAGYTTGHE